LIVGVFSPLINLCGGAEWVAINLISTLRAHRHQVILLTDKKLDQKKFLQIFNKKVIVDHEVVFPLAVLPPPNYANIYTDSLRSLFLKLRCDLLIDTHSNAILPGMDISYIHYPLLSLLQNRSFLLRNRVFYYPYRRFLDFTKRNIHNKLLLSNSKFTSSEVKRVYNKRSYVLYPPVSNDLFNHNKTDLNQERENEIITVCRIAQDKNLSLIPHIARITHKDIRFVIAGLLDSREVLDSLQKLAKKLGVFERIKILPNVKRNKLRRILLTSKVYLHPKVNEHFGVSIVEAMASGCIPIVHDSGGGREFVPKNLRYSSIEGAATKIEKAIDDWSPIQATKFSMIAERFSEKNFAKNFIKLFNSYINK
jgi:glycosyltransferase involved in cell wall biosynthesis